MRQLVEQTAFLLKPRVSPGLDEVGVPDRSAQHRDPALADGLSPRQTSSPNSAMPLWRPSPMSCQGWTRCHSGQRRLGRQHPEPRARGLAEERCRDVLALRMSWVHSPRWKAAARLSNSARPCEPCCAARISNIRGTSSNNFQARAARAALTWLAAGPAAAAARSSLSACVKGGASCSVGARCRNSSERSTASSCSTGREMLALGLGTPELACARCHCR